MGNKTKYDFKKIEAKWRRCWEMVGRDRSVQKDKGKQYILVEFPYPSGSGLHIGHAFTFMGGDIYARFKRMQGFNVMFPMGWDAFGLPTENYAIKTKQKPQQVTVENVARYKEQMKRLAFSFDWSREVNTTDIDYYKWTQWIFIQLFKKGLAYKKEMPINWCPSCKTGLANEEVVDDKCERCGVEVSRRNINQWVVRITDYADRLIDGLEKTDFVEKVKKAQINWIGKSEGARVKFKVGSPSGFCLEVFTTRPDTLYGATFMVVAPEHPLVAEIIKLKALRRKITSETIASIKSYVKKARSKSDLERTDLVKDKTGVFSGMYAINPANGKQIPIWISDFVLASYGTGAIMAVPAHDQRDFEFAKKFGLEIVPVIEPEAGKHDFSKQAYTEVDRGRSVNSPKWDNMKPSQAIKKAILFLKNEGIGEEASNYHLRDWIFSRQHYWGEPIPMIYCVNCAKNHNFQSPNCQKKAIKELKKYAKENKIDIKALLENPGWAPVGEKDLPIELPEVGAYEPTDTGESPLAKIESFVKCRCPVCGGEASRETDTMPNWAGSDWYFLAYCFAKKLNLKSDGNIFSLNNEALKYWMPVDVYIGGDEHNTLHLLYSRFIYQFLHDMGVVPANVKEPYYKRISHGVILGSDNQKMSKSRGNVIIPDDVADKVGVDVIRCYLMFMGPYDNTMAWNERTLMGVRRFLGKFYRYVLKQVENNQGHEGSDSNKEVELIINKLIVGVTNDLSKFKYNTAIAKMMEGLNQLRIKDCKLTVEEIEVLIKLLAPFAPYMTEELYSLMFDKVGVSIHGSDWPVADEKYLIEDKILIPVAINGKKRGEMEIESQSVADEAMILEMARRNEQILKWTKGKEIVRQIYVLGRMVNLVVK